MLTGYGPGVPSFVQTADGATAQSQGLFTAFDPSFLGGVFVAVN